MGNRVTYDEKGRLDEVVTDAGAQLEHMGGRRYFLDMVRSDGSSFAIWFTGKIDMTEERPPSSLSPTPPEDSRPFVRGVD